MIVDLAVDVVGVCQIDQFRTRVEVAIIPAREAHAGGSGGRRQIPFMQAEQHELPRVQAEPLFAQCRFHGSAEGHELRFHAREMWQGAHMEEHFLKQAGANAGLRMLGRDVQAPN